MNARRCFLIVLMALFAAALPLTAQDMLSVARTQMAAGHTSDARLLVEGYLAGDGGERDKALYYRAILAARADSARPALLETVERGGRTPESLGALERLGDLDYTRGQYKEAAARFKSAADRAGDPETSRRCLVKFARARIKAGDPGEATKVLRRAQALGESEHRGMVLYHLALARERTGDSNGAAEDYLKLYLDDKSPYQLASLSRLTRIYGAGDSKAAVQWRDRLAASAAGTVFDPARVQPENSAETSVAGDLPGTWSIQLGAFSSRDRASGVAADVLHRTGLQPVVLAPAGDKLYRVRIRGLASQQEALRAETILKKNHIQYTVIKPGG